MGPGNIQQQPNPEREKNKAQRQRIPPQHLGLERRGVHGTRKLQKRNFNRKAGRETIGFFTRHKHPFPCYLTQPFFGNVHLSKTNL